MHDPGMSRATALPPVDVAPGISYLERYDDSGWGWNIIVVQLPGGGTLVHSPSWLDDRTLERVAELGTPRILFAPNHFHFATLHRFQARWPEALAVASPRALPRLAKKGVRGLVPIDAARPLLPTGAEFHQPDGTKTGETWLSLPRAGGTTLLVCDAFFNVVRPTSGAFGLVLRALKVVPGLRISTTYRMLGVSDVAVCRASTISLVRAIAPTEVAFSHGEMLRGPDCGDRLVGAVEARWPAG